jgi:hypothetical protein
VLSDVREGKPPDEEKIDALMEKGTISESTAGWLKGLRPDDPVLLGYFIGLDIRDKLDVWEKASPEEREVLKDKLYMTRREAQHLARTLPPGEYQAITDRIARAKDEALAAPATPPPPTEAVPTM